MPALGLEAGAEAAALEQLGIAADDAAGDIDAILRTERQREIACDLAEYLEEHLHGRKYQEELDVWLRKIRDEAFVDIK